MNNTFSVKDKDDFKTYRVWEALGEPEAWLLVLYTFSVKSCRGGPTTVSLSTLPAVPLLTRKYVNNLLIRGFGSGSLQSLLLQILVGGRQLAVLELM